MRFCWLPSSPLFLDAVLSFLVLAAIAAASLTIAFVPSSFSTTPYRKNSQGNVVVVAENCNSWRRECRHERHLSSILYAKSKKTVVEIPPNEFSRTVQPDRILKSTSSSSSSYSSSSGSSGGSSTANGYALTIEADATERQALAQRFALSDIASLSADLLLRSCSTDASSSSGSSASSIEVEGTCKATVTQRCVRTNDDFAVDIEFPLYCIVRPAVPTSLGGQAVLDAIEDEIPDQQQRKSKSTSNSRQGGVDLGEMQRLLEKSIRDSSDGSISSTTDEDDALMEDESIYSVDSNLLDVGELVAQLFWLKLDPYPKKPGTSPVQHSITG